MSLRGSSVDLLHLLFGSILAVDRDAALFVSGVASLTLLCIALCYRGLVCEAFDSAWLQVNYRRLPALLHGLFLALLVLNLVAGFQVLRHADGGRGNDAPGGRRALLGAHAAGHSAAGGGNGRALRLAGIKPLLGD